MCLIIDYIYNHAGYTITVWDRFIVDCVIPTGLVSRCMGIMPEKALKMHAWSVVGKALEKRELSSLPKYLIAGSAAGVATTVFGCPSERIMVLAHIRKQGVIHVAKEIGFKGMYQGWRVTLHRDIVFNAFFFTVRDMLVDLRIMMSSQHECNKFERFLAGLPAGEHTHTHTHSRTHARTHTRLHAQTGTHSHSHIHIRLP